MIRLLQGQTLSSVASSPAGLKNAVGLKAMRKVALIPRLAGDQEGCFRGLGGR
jgi:hypothetical protein